MARAETEEAGAARAAQRHPVKAPGVKAPGLKWRALNGKAVALWRARPDLIKRGYAPKNVALHYDAATPQGAAELIARCHKLQSEMLEWASRKGARKLNGSVYDGRLETLVQLYQTDPDSPFHELNPGTQDVYARVLRAFFRCVQGVYVNEIVGTDLRRWFRMLSETRSVGYAALILNVLKVAVSFGASQGWQDCITLRALMSATRLKSGRRRKQRLTYEQVVAFRAAAHRLGRPSAALWVTLQFELTMRRRDVIGEWIEDDGESGRIRNGKWLWRDGLSWNHIDHAGVLKKLISKTAKTSEYEVEHRLSDYPELVAELERSFPPQRPRIGPLVINESSGLPYTPEQCRHYFRIIARAAGIPDAVWNMDARAGAVTEAYEAGASTEGAMASAGHTELATSLRYRRRVLEQTSAAAKLRIANRGKQ